VVLTDDSLLGVLHDAASAVRAALDRLPDWGLVGSSRHQYRHDVVADEAARHVLVRASVGVLSEESGAHGLDAAIVVVLDPVDGSTNASRGLPWWNTSLCALDRDGPRAALVVDQVHGTRFEAVRGQGARRDGHRIVPSECTTLRDAVVGLNGFPRAHLGWKQYRALGATALDLCAVASGMLDAYVDCTRRGSAAWDYLGGIMVCEEAGAPVADARGDDLVVRSAADRRCPVAAATAPLLAGLLEQGSKFS
jgi:fructose-1,6-bisphosphatase/inositol monophosphatase family enzyme